MTRITAADQIVLLLREELRRAAAERRGRAATSQTKAPATSRSRVAALAGLKSMAPDEFRRAVVRSLVAERLGEALANEPALEETVRRVSGMIEDSEEGRTLLDEAAALLGAGA